MCYHAEFGRSASSMGVGTNTGEPRNWGTLESALLDMRRCRPQDTRPSPHVKFGSSATEGVHINRRKKTKLEIARSPPPCDNGVADSLQVRLIPPRRVILPNSVVLGQTVRALLRRSA